MRYVFAIIAGFLVGATSHDGDGYIIGGIIGFMLVQLFELKSKVKQLEHGLLNRKTEKINTEFKAQKPVTIQEPEQILESDMETDDSITQSQESIIKESESIITETVINPEVDSKSEVIKQPKTAIEKDIKKESFEIDRDLIKQMSPEYYDEIVEAKVTRSESQKQIKPPKKVIIQPSVLEIGMGKIKSWVVGYFTGGNSMVRAGMLVLFIGVAFLLKYVAERTVVPVEYRYIGVSIASFFMLFIGWKLRKKRPGFALSLKGGGIGLLYLTLFAAMRIHQLLPAKVVLILLVAIVVLSALLAVLENSMALAVIGMIGGFAAPILTSTGSGSHVQLFSYYLLLNIGVFAIAWFKSWRILNVVGFIATFGIGTLWGYQYYKPEFLISVEPFLISYFLLYTIIAVLFAIKQPPKLRGINDGTIIFGTPLVGFALQAALIKDSEYGLAYSALALGVFYLILSFILKMMKKPYMKDLIESFVALGIGFATLAIPLGFDGRVTSAIWVAEGCALVWVGIRQSRMFPRFSGYLLTAFGAAAFFIDPHSSASMMPWLNADYVGEFIIVCATAFISLYARSNTSKLLSVEAKWIPTIMMVSSVVWWLYAGINEIKIHYKLIEFIILELFFALTIFALLFIGNKIRFNLLKISSILVAFLMLAVINGSLPLLQVDNPIFWNMRFIGLILIATVHLFLSWFWLSVDRHKLSIHYNYLSYVFLLTGLILWLVTFTIEIMSYYPVQQFVLIQLMMAISSFVLLATGIRLKSQLYQLSSVAVVLMMIVPMVLIPKSDIDLTAIGNVAFLGLLIYSLSHFIMSWYWQKQDEKVFKVSTISLSNILLSIGILAWLFMGHNELYTYLQAMDFYNSSMIFVSLSSVIFILLAHGLNWQSLHLAKYAYTLYLIFMGMMIVSEGFKLHHSYGLFVWSLSFIINYWVLKVYDKKMQYIQIYHLFSLLLICFITVFEFVEFIQYLTFANSIWHKASSSVMLLIIALILYLLKNSMIWPLKIHKTAYSNYGLLIILTITWLEVFGDNLSSPGTLLFIPYFPFLNILDITGFGLIILAYKVLTNRIMTGILAYEKSIKIALAITAFLVLNASMLRCFHFWYGIDYKWNVMLKSFLIQSGFSILWSLTAVILMVLAAKKHLRTMWLVGLGLMIVVVAKLFLVDMSASGTVERIVAFLTVGVLLSVVGYFSPLPPDLEKTRTDEKVKKFE